MPKNRDDASILDIYDTGKIMPLVPKKQKLE